MNKQAAIAIDDFKRAVTGCRLPLCIGVDGGAPIICAEVMEKVEQFPFESGNILQTDADELDEVAILAVGVIGVEWNTDDGRRQVLEFLFRGDVLNLPSGNGDVRAVALTNGILYRLDKDQFSRCRNLRTEDPAWEITNAQDMLARATAHNMMLGRLHASERIAAFLIALADRIGVVVENGTRIDLLMGRDDIADHLGLNSETVSRQLSRLRAANIIEMPKPGLVIVIDKEELINSTPLARG